MATCALGLAEKANEAAQFTFNLLGKSDGAAVAHLDYCMSRMVDLISTELSSAIGRLGFAGAVPAKQLSRSKAALQE
jgi:hypothetical protein